MMKLKEVRWGFIGCGEVTEKKSGPAFNMIEGSKVVAVMSRDEEKVKSYAIRHNIPVITYPTGIPMPKSLSAMKM